MTVNNFRLPPPKARVSPWLRVFGRNHDCDNCDNNNNNDISSILSLVVVVVVVVVIVVVVVVVVVVAVFKTRLQLAEQYRSPSSAQKAEQHVLQTAWEMGMGTNTYISLSLSLSLSLSTYITPAKHPNSYLSC